MAIPCYKCRVKKERSEMEDLGVWVCKECLEELDNNKKKKMSLESEEFIRRFLLHILP